MTYDDTRSEPSTAAAEPGVPGLVIVFSRDRACHVRVPLAGGVLELGRDLLAAHGLTDERVSRSHARVKLVGGVFVVDDRGSKNGTFVNGARVGAGGDAFVKAPHVVRVGGTLSLLVERLEAFAGGVDVGREIVGPRLRAVKSLVETLAVRETSLLLRGETGAGKELAASWFHAAGPRARGPLVPVNCAAVPRELAERLFFGSVRGAFSGALDSVGYAQAADGGTLFLDEVGELDLGCQAKLLRLLEAREVTPLGAQRARKLDVRVVAATHRVLRDEVAAGRFRADLYYRLAQPEVRLPPLRERLEEVPYLIERACAPAPAPALVEQALCRPWPGNVRELLAAVRASAAPGERGLGEAGERVGGEPDGLDARHAPRSELRLRVPAVAAELDRVDVERALKQTAGNISQAAERLGVSRSRLRRFLEREGVEREGGQREGVEREESAAGRNH